MFIHFWLRSSYNPQVNRRRKKVSRSWNLNKNKKEKIVLPEEAKKK